MKLLLLLLALPMIGFGQNVGFGSITFKGYLVGNSAINTNGDNEIQVSEASAYNGTINCSSMFINSLIGIEAFVSLTSLDCSNNLLSRLDVSSCAELTSLNCSYNPLNTTQVTSLNASGCTALTSLYCSNTQLRSIDLSGCTALTSLLYFYSGNLTSVDISGCT